MPKTGPAFVHHLGLALRVKVLRDLAHDAHDFALPWLQQWRMFLHEVKDVFLRLGREAHVAFALVAPFAELGNGAPEVVDLLLQMLFPTVLLKK